MKIFKEKKMENKHFNFFGDDCIIRSRRAAKGKTPLYIYNLSKMAYVSGLKEISPTMFYFQPMGKEEYYLLVVSDCKLVINEVTLEDIFSLLHA